MDVLLVSKGLAQSREKAKAIIKSGNVYVDGRMTDKAADMVDENAVIDIRENPLKYVSRGGLKLEKAIDKFNIDLKGKICMDVGASTGGFTDCMLQKGAAKVYAVDVGTDQLANELRNDSRVISMEQTNIRYLTPDQIKDEIAFISIDVSFISLTKVLTVVKELLTEQGELVALIKPQFEVGPNHIGKKGVVKDKKAHLHAISSVCLHAFAAGYKCVGLDYSPITGPEGNIEYLLYLKKDNIGNTSDSINVNTDLPQSRVQALVEEAHKSLK